jgi:adenylate kinase family enzyme
MDRIVIMGCSAGGKSTIARELSQILGIEVIHLDKVIWKPGCQLSDPSEEPDMVRELLDRPQWIMDGNYTASLDMRLARADTVIMIDFSRFRCLVRALKRLFQFRGTTRPDMGANCPEELNFNFLSWIWNYPRKERPELLRRLREHGSHAHLVRLRTAAEAERWLDQLRAHPVAAKEADVARAN